jgi:hypothetical protein
MKCKLRVNFVLKAAILLEFGIAGKRLQSYKTLITFSPKTFPFFFNLFI